MTNNEQRILEYIQHDPFISQQELADHMALSRSAVANIISSLVKKGKLLGKAYIINQPHEIVCIGAANVDKKIKSYSALISGTSNPVSSVTSLGGVARNVAENLGRLGRKVTLLSVVGNDSEGHYVKQQSEIFMDITPVRVLAHQSTGTYTAILDDKGDLVFGLADMSIYDSLSKDILENVSLLLQQSQCIVIDLNCSKEAIEYVCEIAKRYAITLVLITVSEPKMANMPDDLSAVNYLIVNKSETEAFFNQKANNKHDLEQLAKRWQSLGVSVVVLTNGEQDVLLANETCCWYAVKPVASHLVIDVTGAGDAFSGAFVDAIMDSANTIDPVVAGLSNAYYTIQTSQTVRHDLNKPTLLENIKEYHP